MAEIQIPYARRQLARVPGGRGGTPSIGVVRQPQISGMAGGYDALAQAAGDIEQAIGGIAGLVEQRQKARDVATLTALEANIDEQVAAKSQEILRDHTIHPYDYRQLLSDYRNSLLDSAEVPDRLKTLAKGKITASTQRYIQSIDAEGTKRGQEQAVTVYDYYMEQQSRAFLDATTPEERDDIGNRMRAKTEEYIQSGILSPDQAAVKLRDRRDKTMYEALELAAIKDPKGFLKGADQGLLNGLPGEARVKLIDKAQTERREAADWQDSEDRRAERVLDNAQELNASALRERIYAMGGGQGALRAVQQALDNREIGPKQHDNLMGFAIRLQSERASQAASAEARKAAAAQRAEIAQRRADENTVGMLEAKMLANAPGPDGQLLSPHNLLDMAASGKINGNVAGEAARRADAYIRRIEEESTTQQRADFDNVLKASEALFNQQGLNVRQDQNLQQAWATYQERLRSAVFVDKQNPYEVMNKIINDHIGAATGALKERVKVILNTLPAPYRPTPGEGIEMQKQILQRDFIDGAIRKGAYETIRRQLYELEKYPDFTNPLKPSGSSQAPPQSKGLFQRMYEAVSPSTQEPRPPLPPEGQ